MESGKGRKVRRTARRLHADLVALGYDGSYARVAAFIRDWQAERTVAQRTTGRGVFVPLTFQPGEAFQFDWSEDWATIAGKRVKLQVAHTKLSHSRAFVIRAHRLQHDEEAVLCAVELALEGGVATKTHVLNILHRLMDSKGTTAIIDAPQALSLNQEPRADIERYDALRHREVRHAS